MTPVSAPQSDKAEVLKLSQLLGGLAHSRSRKTPVCRLMGPKGEEVASDRYGRVSVLDTHGTVLARYGGGAPDTPGNFTAPHGIAVDSKGDVYVAEVTWTFGVSAGAVRDGAPTIQKLARA